MASQSELLSRIAAGDGHGENSSYFDGWKAYDADPFDLHHNPGGVIQMGLAENQLSLDLIEEWSLNHPEASICTPQGASQFKRIANSQDYHGLPEFRQVSSLIEITRSAVLSSTLSLGRIITFLSSTFITG
jgi:1-aminocyclopropane-1-carboxylate synthase 1/2/6